MQHSLARTKTFPPPLEKTTRTQFTPPSNIRFGMSASTVFKCPLSFFHSFWHSPTDFITHLASAYKLMLNVSLIVLST